MANVRKARNPWGIAIFVALVIVSGVALNLTRNMQNPFQVIPDMVNFVTNGEQTPGEGGGRPEGGRFEGGPPAGANITPGAFPGRGERQPRGNATPAAGVTPAASSVQTPFGGNNGQFERRGEGGGEMGGIQWNLIGGVLFNLWFVAACTAALVLLNVLFTALVKRLRRPKPATA